ncbi:hypothetical protein EST38_g14174 [Candolleomyces aberdarensis]|uniref:Uncharacterized protein n=1 Tax=Candolleomyces aberdarensis TaxID=2316362 RepID=A0A4Q2CZ33_9AGAR|nr:hypothetical protein EST38_g14174 [Candolleomyces aberdarensis]
MSQLLSLHESCEAEKKGRSWSAREKAEQEKKASLELREAAMNGIVKRQGLIDIAQLDGATAREKSGQRLSKRPRASSSVETVPDGENVRPAAKRARSTTQQVRGAILEHQASINERLVEARARDKQFRTDIRDSLSALAKSMATLGRENESDAIVIIDIGYAIWFARESSEYS